MNVLAIAYACNPYQGSEEGVGWGWVREIAKRHSVHIITAEYQRQPLELYAKDHPEFFKNIVFHFVAPKPWHYRPSRFWKRVDALSLTPLVNFAYMDWQRHAYRLACRLHARFAFDLVHLITYVGFRFPGRFWQKDIPLVWGPLGGLENVPWRFLPMLGWKGCLHQAAWNTVNSLQKRFLPGPRRAFKKAAGGIIAATDGIRREILRWYAQESQVICEIGTPPVISDQVQCRRPEEPLKLVWSGLHLPRKALPLLLEALAEVSPALPWQLTVLGQGPCTRTWQRRAEALGVGDRCQWTGWLPRDQSLMKMQEAHVMVITSLKDLTSTVLIEALAQGLPVICPDLCGFPDVVTAECGIKIPVVDRKQFRGDLAAAIEQLAQNESQRQLMAAGALRRVRDFSWENKGESVDRIYRHVLESVPPESRRPC